MKSTTTNGTRPSRLAALVDRRLIEKNASQREIAEKVGFKNQNMITMVKTGTAKLALDRVPAMARALDVDPSHLFRLALEQFYDKAGLKALTDILDAPLSRNEQAILNHIREVSDNSDPALTEETQEKLTAIFAAASKDDAAA